MPIHKINNRMNVPHIVTAKIPNKRVSPLVKKTSAQVARLAPTPKNPVPVQAKKPRVIHVSAAERKKTVERPDLQEVRSDLAKKLNDIERADQIIHDYATILEKKIPNGENKNLFEKWMSGIAYFLGSPHYDHNLFFHHNQGNAFFQNNKEFKAAFESFSKQIKTHTHPLHKAINTAHKVKNIAIMYPGTGGGGHKSPAMAMAKNLEAKGYKVKLIDSDEYEKPYDPKIDGLTRGEIYSKVYQQQGDVGKAAWMWEEGNRQQPLKDRKYIRDITDTLRNFKADQLFVVAHHQPQNATLAYQLGIPTTYVHTDNEFHYDLMDLCLNQQEIKKPLISFASLSNHEDFYHHLIERDGKTNYDQLSSNIRRQMVPLNFPVRENFKQITKSEKTALRKTLKIDPKATVVKVAMGANGIPSDIKMILDRIKTEAHLSAKPLHVLVVCGANAELKNELDRMNMSDAGVKFQVLGFLNEKEMSDFDKASDVWVTKPGGATSAEALAMHKQMLYLVNPHHIWELTNARRLETQNMAEELKANESIISQINRRALIGEKIEHVKTKDAGWTDQLAHIVHKTAKPLLAVV